MDIHILEEQAVSIFRCKDEVKIDAEMIGVRMWLGYVGRLQGLPSNKSHARSRWYGVVL